MRHPLCLALVAALSACSAQVTPDASVSDASAPDTSARDSSSSDVSSTDASAPDATVPDVSEPDASAPDASDAAVVQWSPRGDSICGVSIVANPPANEFALAYGYQSGRVNELHFARLRTDGTLIADTLIASGGADPLCVARYSLAINTSAPDARRYALAAQRRTATGGAIELFVLDANGALKALGARDSAVGARLTAGNMLVINDTFGPQVVYDAMDGAQRQLRLLQWDAPVGGRDVETLGLRGRDSVPLALDAARPVVIGRSNLGGGFVAVHSSDDGGSLLGRHFDLRGWRSDPITLDRGEFIAPVWASVTGSGSVSIAYELGVRSRTLRLVTLGIELSTPRTIAENTAWNSTDAVRDAEGQDATTWVSHGGGGYNSSVMLWREFSPAPTCPLLTSSVEDSTFTQVAQARFASRNQMIVAIRRDVPPRSTPVETLVVRALGDGEPPCR